MDVKKQEVETDSFNASEMQAIAMEGNENEIIGNNLIASIDFWG